MKDIYKILKYVVFDFISVTISWYIFDVSRFELFKDTISFYSLNSFLFCKKGLMDTFFAISFLMMLNWLSGYYSTPRQKKILSDFISTFLTSVIGVVFLFFLFVIDDYPSSPSLIYESFFILLFSNFGLVFLFRVFITNKLVHNQYKGIDCVNVLVIGVGEKAQAFFEKFNKNNANYEKKIIGFAKLEGEVVSEKLKNQNILKFENIQDVIISYNIESFVYTGDLTDNERIKSLYKFYLPIETPVSSKEILNSQVSLSSLFGIPMKSLVPTDMLQYEKNIKLIFDKLVSSLALIVTIPFTIVLSLLIKMDSKGPVFYKQERLGKNGVPFNIIKFRTMYQGSEKGRPILAIKKDKRVTRIGAFMRKYRIDEIPQFINVFKGDMSIVGPRPERLYFVEKIVINSPEYYLLQMVKPGITSWGIVKFGYANTIEKMRERMDYDILYIKNRSIFIDFKIMFFTLKPIFLGKGL